MSTTYFCTYNAIFDAPVSGSAKLVYAYLCKCADKNGKCWPLHRTAKRVGEHFGGATGKRRCECGNSDQSVREYNTAVFFLGQTLPRHVYAVPRSLLVSFW